MFRYKKSIPLSYERQGYIYFTSRKYKELTARQQARIDEVCRRAGGDYAEALKEFVTTDRGEVSICMRHYLSKTTLGRCVKRYYLEFPEKI